MARRALGRHGASRQVVWANARLSESQIPTATRRSHSSSELVRPRYHRRIEKPLITRRSDHPAVDLSHVLARRATPDDAHRVLGIFAHPDDEVFCAGGSLAACAAAGVDTAVVSLTQGEAGEIRDVAAATRRTLGARREVELAAAGRALGVGSVRCHDLGDGRLEQRTDEIAEIVRAEIESFDPDVVITFGPDGGSGHPDHVASSVAVRREIEAMPHPPRLLHAAFPRRDQLLVDTLVDWLSSGERRFVGTTAFAYALKLFADGTSMLGFAADHFDLAWYPAGSFVIEQGEPADQLFCILSGSVEVVVERDDGRLDPVQTFGAGCFVGEDGLATGRPRNAHVIAREPVTCLVLAPSIRSTSAGRGAHANGTAGVHGVDGPRPAGSGAGDDVVAIDVSAVLDRKVAALAAHRSQYALEPELFPTAMLEQLLGVEYFSVVVP